MGQRKTCQACRNGAAFEIPFTMAFQPIVEISTGRVFAYEALLRGVDGEGAGTILGQVNSENQYAFDQACRVTAIEHAARLGLVQDGAYLSINFLPNAVYEPRACIRLTVEAALRTGFPVDRIMFEFTEVEKLDVAHLLNILQTYHTLGFKTAIDDFGAGYSDLGLLARYQPDVLKLDMDLIRNIDTSPVKRSMVHNLARMAQDIGVLMVCEGIETEAEYSVLHDLGIDLMQGYLFAKPAVEALPVPDLHREALTPRAANM